MNEIEAALAHDYRARQLYPNKLTKMQLNFGIEASLEKPKCTHCGQRAWLINSFKGLKRWGIQYTLGYQCDASNQYPMVHCKCGFDICRHCEKRVGHNTNK